MKQHGMIFNGEMVRAILDGRKTQTRRPTKFDWSGSAESLLHQSRFDPAYRSPFGTVGDIIWVRETWMIARKKNKELAFGWVAGHVWSKDPIVKCPHNWADRNIPSIHMPRWASRIDLEVAAVRVERVQDISEEDAKSEGVFRRLDGPNMEFASTQNGTMHWNAKDAFRDLWQSIYSNWDANPFVWVYEFRRVK